MKKKTSNKTKSPVNTKKSITAIGACKGGYPGFHGETVMPLSVEIGLLQEAGYTVTKTSDGIFIDKPINE